MNPVQYAEDVLNVHGVFDEAESVYIRYTTALDAHTDNVAAVRTLREGLADAEAEVSVRERAANPDQSVTAFEKHLKDVLRNDSEVRKIRHNLMEAQYAADQSEADIKRHDGKLKMLAARMEELGGLLNYFAATKMAASKKQAPAPTAE